MHVMEVSVEKFITWMVAFMVSQAPPGRPMPIESAQESKEDAEVRYESIARSIATVVKEEEPLFAGTRGRVKTAAVILSVMSHESAFRKDVDFGVGKYSAGDNGNSVCLMQLNIGKNKTGAWNTKLGRFAWPSDPVEDVVEGWTAKELLADRTKCIRAGYRVLRMSFAGTRHLPTTEWLRIYASGSADKGSQASKTRMGLALKYYAEHQPDFTDDTGMDPELPFDPIATYLIVNQPAWSKKPAFRTFVLPSYY